MLLKKLKLSNYRQFSGDHILNLSTTSATNVIVIHGENGAGKTSILNAFKWCLYGKTDFDSGEELLVSESAIFKAALNDRIQVVVELQFEDEGELFAVRRELTYQKTGPLKAETIGKPIVRVDYTEHSASKLAHNPQVRINQILPEEMQPYFFFNGERIEKLAGASNSFEIRNAIKVLMGIEFVERAMKHVSQNVVTRFQKELKGCTKGELQKKAELFDSLNEDHNKLLEDHKVENKNLNELRTEIQSIETELGRIKEAAVIVEERKRLEVEKNSLEGEIKNNNWLVRERLRGQGMLAFSGSIFDKCRTIAHEKKSKGELPSLVRASFIDGLIDSGKCICGLSLSSNPDHVAHLNEYRNSKTTSSDVEDSYLEVVNNLSGLEEKRYQLFGDINSLIESRIRLQSELGKIIGSLDDLSDTILEDIPNAKSYEERRVFLTGCVEDSIKKIGVLEDKLSIISQQITELDQEIKELSKLDTRARLISERIDFAKSCAFGLEKLHAALSKTVRSDISDLFGKTYANVTRKPYSASISDSYTLSVKKTVGTVQTDVLGSTGEKQIASLAFIGSIVAYARKHSVDKSVFIKGGVYPIVMDSPFGALGFQYSQKISQFIPELASQIILMVSPTQWRAEVKAEIERRIEREYSLVYEKVVTAEGEFELSKIVEGYHV